MGYLMGMLEKNRSIFIMVSITIMVSSCAGITPSKPSITEITSLNRVEDIPPSFNVSSISIDGVPRLNQEILHYMKKELKDRGFIVVEADPVAIFVGRVRWSSHAISGTNILLHMNLQRKDSGSVIWACEIKRDYDIYSSLIDGIKNSIDKSLDCLSKNIQALRK